MVTSLLSKGSVVINDECDNKEGLDATKNVTKGMLRPEAASWHGSA